MRTKAQQAVVARALSQITESQGSLISVVAAPGYKLPENPTLAAFACKNCGTHFAAHQGAQPFCVTCGSGDAVEPDKTAKATPESLTEDQGLTGVACYNCHATNIMTNKVLSKLGGAMHCVMCGGDLSFDGARDDLDAEDLSDGVDPLVEETEDTGGDDFTDPNDVEPVATGEDVEEGASTTNKIEEEESADDLDPPVGVENEDQTSLPMIDPNADEPVDVSMDELNPDDVDADDIQVIQTSNMIYALARNVPVATLNPEEAGANADLIGKPAFVRAVKAAVERNGLKAGLKELGFKAIIAKFPFKKIVDARVEELLAAEKAKVQASVTTVAADYHQSLLIAMAGLHKNFFRGKVHPLKAALFDELTAAGVRSPEKLIDRVFKTHGNTFLSALAEIAEDLRGKPEAIRNELAKAVDAANYMEGEADDGGTDDDDADDADNLEMSATAQLATHDRLLITKPAAQTASVQGDAPGRITRQSLFGARV